ncbi:MAG: DUF5683 domain-containing protein [Rikenellaceae bacterium]
MLSRNLSKMLKVLLVLLLVMTTSAVACLGQEHKRYEVVNGVLVDSQSNVSLIEEASIGSDSIRNLIRALSDTLTKAELRAIIRENKVRDPYITFRDSMPISRVCMLSVPLPGFSQVYNKQYYKLPILYGTVATTALLYSNQNKKYQSYKSEYDQMVAVGDSRQNIDPVQTKMIQHNTNRQLLLAGALASYIYFIGDGALNYQYETNPIKKATTLSTICPGAGQIYNKSFWKVPIILGGFATMGYIIDFNNRGYKRFQTAYNLASDGDDLTVDEFGGAYSESVLLNMRKSYRRNRDLSIIITAGFYLLNIIDAHVDAHMKDYDISDDISSISILPTTIDCVTSTGSTQGYGLSLCYSF